MRSYLLTATEQEHLVVCGYEGGYDFMVFQSVALRFPSQLGSFEWVHLGFDLLQTVPEFRRRGLRDLLGFLFVGGEKLLASDYRFSVHYDCFDVVSVDGVDQVSDYTVGGEGRGEDAWFEEDYVRFLPRLY